MVKRKDTEGVFFFFLAKYVFGYLQTSGTWRCPWPLLSQHLFHEVSPMYSRTYVPFTTIAGVKSEVGLGMVRVRSGLG